MTSDTKRRETALAMRFVHYLLTPVIFGVAMFGIGLVAAQEDKSRNCGVGRCQVVTP